MELKPNKVRHAHRMSESDLKDAMSAAAEEIVERLAGCTLLGEAIDFDDEDQVLVAVYYLGNYDLLDLALGDLC